MSAINILPFVVLIGSFVINMPIGLGMMATGITYLILNGFDLGLFSDVIMSNIQANSVLIAVPLFIFTANIMESGKVTDYMFTFTKALVGKRKGAMAYINIILSLIFSGMTGSALADASGIGIMELSEMKKDGYDDEFSAAITAATAVVGPIFPPSIPMVIYALLAGTSVGSLFMGGIIPAIMVCLALGAYVWFISRKRNYPKGKLFTKSEFLTYTWKALPALLTPVILLGGIYSGIVTSTEAGALAALWALGVSIFCYKVMTLKKFLEAVKKTVVQTANIMVMVFGAYILSYMVARMNIATGFATWFSNITTNKYVFLLLVNIFVLFLGMIFDTSIIQFVFLPLLLPLVKALGIDLIHFGVLVTLNMLIGFVTPPYGILCFITSSLSHVPLKSVFKEVIPMTIMLLVVLLLVTYIPALSMAIPSAMVH